MSTKIKQNKMRGKDKSFDKRVVVYSHLLASCHSHCVGWNSQSVDATDCNIQFINGLAEIS